MQAKNFEEKREYGVDFAVKNTLLGILKQVCFLWNRTVVVVVDKLSSTSVDFIRSEVDESLSTTTTTVLFQRKPTCFKMYSTE